MWYLNIVLIVSLEILQYKKNLADKKCMEKHGMLDTNQGWIINVCKRPHFYVYRFNLAINSLS